jgi:hypothetical protein
MCDKGQIDSKITVPAVQGMIFTLSPRVNGPCVAGSSLRTFECALPILGYTFALFP